MRHWLVGIAVSVGWGCGAGAAGEAVRPPEQSAASALGDDGEVAPSASGVACTKVAPKGEPLVVDWKTTDQMNLTLAMQKGVAVVAYDCKSIKLVKECSVKGEYGYAGMGSVLQDAVKIEDADEVQASLPFSGVTFGAEVKRGSSIDIAMAYVGKRAALKDGAVKTDLVGSGCGGATHFVRAATLGAFVVETGTKGQVRAAAEIFGVSAGGGSSSAKKRLNAGGDVAACKETKEGAAKPPDACSAILRLELLPISDVRSAAADDPKKDDAKPLENTCPDGFVPSGGRCAKKQTAKAYRCDSKNLEECTTQCNNGDADSCYSASALLIEKSKTVGPFAKGEPDEPMKQAMAVLQKGCDHNSGRACSSLSARYYFGDGAGKDEAKAEELCLKSCNLLYGPGCHKMGRDFSTKDVPRKVGFYRKGCNLGYSWACYDLATGYLSGWGGIDKNPEEGVKVYARACDNGVAKSCYSVSQLYRTGKDSFGKPVITKDEAKADEFFKKGCALQPQVSCSKK